MRVLTGYMPPTEGRAIVAGYDILEQPLEAKRRTGYLPETPPLYPEMTVRDYLSFVSKIRGVARSDRKARIDSVMEKTRIADMANRHCGKLSKGYRQRVGLAQALLHNPDVLILDEPTDGLDPNQKHLVRELIRSMGDTKAIGRIGVKAMAWFVGASLVSLLVGMILVNLLRPGDNLNLPIPDADASTNLKVASLSMKEFVAHLVPRSVVEAMATNEILQIVVFSLFFGVASASLGERARLLIDGIEQLSEAILTITGYIMALAPIAVFASMAAIVTTQGLGILVT